MSQFANRQDSTDECRRVTREAPDHRYQEWKSLIDAAFLIPEGHSFVDDFPVWNPNLNREILRWSLRDPGGRLLSTASVRFTRVQIPGSSPLQVALMGAVASLPGCHGRGFATQVFGEALRYVEASSQSDIAVLWGSEVNFYSRFGFQLMGDQIQVPLNSINSPMTPLSGKVELGWSPKIFQWLLKRKNGLALSESDYSWVSQHTNVLWCSWVDQGEIKAYAGIGRGIDLPNMVHEWGGYPCALKALLNSVRGKIPGLTLIGPKSEISSFDLVSDVDLFRREHLCLAKMIRSEKKEEAVNHFSNGGIWFWGLDGA